MDTKIEKRFSFKKGWSQRLAEDEREIRAKIISALNACHRNTFYDKLHGKSELKVWEKEAIEKIFAQYGITDIWESVETKTELETDIH